MGIYQPLEDSYLLSKCLGEWLKDCDNKSIRILDMGSGSGIQAKVCREEGFENVLCIDINPEAVDCLVDEGFDAVESDLFSNVSGKFDLIVFNPPYLPEDVREPCDSKVMTTGGKEGYEIIVRFLKDAKSFLSSKGKILFLISSLSKPNIISKEVDKLNYSCKLLGKNKLFFEELFVYEIVNHKLYKTR